ncbi:hypothetical protein LTR16_003933, partial [Cryomyces antarcticus]
MPTTEGSRSVCATAGPEGSYVKFSSYPQGPATFPPNGNKDGMTWTTTIGFGYGPDWYQRTYPDQAAFNVCSQWTGVAPAVALFTASYLTETSTSHENVAAPTTLS